MQYTSHGFQQWYFQVGTLLTAVELTAHFVTQKGHLCHCETLAVRRMQSLHTAGIFTHAVVQEVSEWEIPPSRVVKNNMVAYFCHHFQCEDEHDITKVMRDEGSVTLMLKLTLQSLQLQRTIMKPILELFPLHSAASNQSISRHEEFSKSAQSSTLTSPESPHCNN